MQQSFKRRWKVGAALAGAAALLASTVGLRFGFEHASYDVEQELSTFEVRRYAPRVVAEVTVTASNSKEAGRRGFRILADYIFGKTARPDGATDKIAMTTPVDVHGQGESWTVRFTMPSEHTLDTLPTPADPRVHLRVMPSARFAAARFDGVPEARDFEERSAALRLAPRDAGYPVPEEAQPTFAQYDPPWTPGVLRRNEVLLELSN